MNPDLFFENFELFADAPNGVQKLRELILQLAVMGKLVEQDSNDEPASVLLEKIEVEKKRCITSKKIQDDKKLSSIMKETPPWIIPPSWIWTKLQKIFEITRGGSPRPAGDPQYFGGDIPWITVREITKDSAKYLTETSDFLTGLGSKKSRYIYPSDLLLTNSGATLGVPKISKIEGCINDGVARLNCFHDLVFKHYAYYYLLQQTRAFREVNQGMGQPNLNTSILAGWFFPLPPLAEQKRIVSKVDELMTLCDKLEAHRQKKQELQNKLNSAALDRMLSAENQEEFEQYWQRIYENFDLLYDNPENVEKLRQAILQLAVQGKLVEQNPVDEPASVLIEKIKENKKKIAKEKKIKQIKVLPIKNEDLPFELPDGWEFVRMGDIAEKLGAGSTPLGGSSVYQENGIKFIRSQNVWNNGLKLENVAYISSEIHERMNGTFVVPGDILLNITGASIGRSSLVPVDFDVGNVSQHVSIVRLIDKTIREYMHLCIVSPYIQNLIMNEQVGISREGLSMSRLKEFLIPLPPLAEQKRIVEKVEQLMGLCDELEAKLRWEREESQKLMEAVVKGLLECAVAGKSESDKPTLVQAAVIQLK